jgi:hypothetical protein
MALLLEQRNSEQQYLMLRYYLQSQWQRTLPCSCTLGNCSLGSFLLLCALGLLPCSPWAACYYAWLRNQTVLMPLLSILRCFGVIRTFSLRGLILEFSPVSVKLPGMSLGTALLIISTY